MSEAGNARLRVIAPLVPSQAPINPARECAAVVEAHGGRRLNAKALDASRVALVFQVDDGRIDDLAAVLRAKGFSSLELSYGD